MRVYVTGATGFVGSRVVAELLRAGHSVIGSARSEAAGRALEAAGAAVHPGTLEEPEELARGAEGADAVIHTAFDHDFSRFVENCGKDYRVVTALGRALAGSGRPLLVTSGVAIGSPGPGEPAREDVTDLDYPIPRVATEKACAELLADGVSVAVVRLPQVHDPVKQGLVSPYIDDARARGVAAYVDDGRNRWSAAHVDDVARLYRLALEGHRPGARWHAVAEEGVPMREIAEAVGAGLRVPVRSVPAAEVEAHFGWLAHFAALDMTASSAATRRELGWEPTGPGLVADLRAMHYG